MWGVWVVGGGRGEGAVRAVGAVSAAWVAGERGEVQCGRWAVRAMTAVSAVRAQCVWWGGRVARVVVLGQQWNTILLPSLSFRGASLFLRGKKTCGR